MTRFVRGYRNRRTHRRTLGVVATAMLASILTVAPVNTAVVGAQSGGTEFIRAGQGDVDIVQVVMNHGGQYVVQNAPATSVVDSSSTPLLIESITVNDDGVIKVLDDFNFTGISIQNTNWDSGQTGVRTSQNGVHSTPTDAGFWANVEQVLGSPDLRDYLDISNNSNPALANFEPDFDFFFERPLDNDDYLLVTERWGNTFFDLVPLDADGELIPGSKRLGFDNPYGWNTGYAPSDLTTQSQWFTMADVDSFGVDTDVTPIAGFRINNDGGADVKFFAMAAEPFAPGCPPGSPVEDTPAATSGSWTFNNGKWSASLGSGTVSFTSATGLVVSAGTIDALDLGDFSQPSVAGNASLDILHWFPDAKSVLFEFDPPVANPELHLSRLGGYSGWDEVVWSHSTTIELMNGLTWTETAGNGPHFESTDTTVRRTLGTLLNWPATPENDDFVTGMAGGSLGLTGLIDTMNLQFSATGQQFNEATGDGFEFVFTKPAVEGCGGDTELNVAKAANASTVVVGADVEWSLTADSIGTGAADNATIVDDIPTGVIAKQIRTGSWTPVGIDARFEANVSGSWTTIATVDGNDDVTYNLPSGVEQIRVTYLEDLAVAFDTTSPIRLTTTVDDPPLDNQGEPLAITNCGVWDADDMAEVQSCASVDVELLNAKPDLTLSTLTGVATPGDTLSHQIRIENLASAAKPYLTPFVAVLLPDNLDYEGWQPLSAEEPPTITVTENYNGTGRTLVRWNYIGAASDLTAGEVFDVRLTTRIRAASPAGPSTLQVVTGTNDDTWQVECVDPEIADVFDHDSDGLL
ncbi:MAG: hypothetical protein GXP35_01950, partial [Actinobacteria bacterium]|nr:hypothetical protein [Actinomycetota bacterium]